MKDFKDWKVWTKSHEMTLGVYGATRPFPKEELYGLTSQLRRSAASIGANIAEGCGRRSDGELTRFLQIARGSPASWNITCSWRVICTYCKKKASAGWTGRSLKYNEC